MFSDFTWTGFIMGNISVILFVIILRSCDAPWWCWLAALVAHFCAFLSGVWAEAKDPRVHRLLFAD